MTEEEKKIYANGERLIPGITHKKIETVRHLRSYEFFKAQIGDHSEQFTILDLGCGVGWGTKLLSSISNSVVVGADINEDCIRYAKDHYHFPNITYVAMPAEKFVGISFDYIVARGVFEHLDNHFQIIKRLKYNRKLMFDVPYRELSRRNPYHKWKYIRMSDFRAYPNLKFYFEYDDGTISDIYQPRPRLLMIVSSDRKDWI